MLKLRERTRQITPERYLAFEVALFLRSAQRFFISSDSLFRPAGLSLLTGLVLVALLSRAVVARCLACGLEFDPVRILRAEVSLTISASIS